MDAANACVKHMTTTIGKEDQDKEAVARMAATVKRFADKDQDKIYNQPFSLLEIEDIIRNLPDTAPGADKMYSQFVKKPPNRMGRSTVGNYK